MRAHKFVLVLAVLGFFCMQSPARADEDNKPIQDQITYQTSVEGWVTTKTARVVIGVDAASSSQNGVALRQDMQETISDIAPKADWRLVSFSRSQDQAGLEHWTAAFEARLTESDLSGLEEKAKKASKAGMQFHVNETSFTPSLAEIEDAKTALRQQLYQMAEAELGRINQSLPEKNYRIGEIDFTDGAAVPAAMPVRPHVMMRAMSYGSNGADAASAEGASSESESAGTQVSIHLTQSMEVVFSAIVAAAGK